MKIRYAKLKNVPELSRFIKSIINTTPYYSVKAKAEEIKKHNSQALRQYLNDRKYYYCFVATEKRKIVGFIIGRNEAGVFWGDWVGVHKDHRRKGVAEMLKKKLEQHLKQKGAHKIWCDTRTNNKEAISLLKKLKYRKLGEFKNGWYKQDFFLWEKDLGTN